MKIAVVSDEGKTISQHFGRAPLYVVLTIEEGQVIAREIRDKMGHGSWGHEHGDQATHDHLHGFGDAAQRRHQSMIAAIADCQVLLVRGMGSGAYEHIKQAGIQPVITDMAEIDQAVQAYLAGTLSNHLERLH